MAAKKKKMPKKMPKPPIRPPAFLAGCDPDKVCDWVKKTAKHLRNKTHQNGIIVLWEAVRLLERHIYCGDALGVPIIADCNIVGGGGDKTPPPPPPDFP